MPFRPTTYNGAVLMCERCGAPLERISGPAVAGGQQVTIDRDERGSRRCVAQYRPRHIAAWWRSDAAKAGE